MNSIATKTGDNGTTGLIYGRRVSKTDPIIIANGAVDSLNTALGMVKAFLPPTDSELYELIETIQKNLVNLMGEVAVVSEDWERYDKSRMPHFDEALINILDQRVTYLEEQGFTYEGWATPGGNPQGALLDSARTACRTAEIELNRINNKGLLNPVRSRTILSTTNRLSDVLWLEARRAESIYDKPAQ
jgi:cob(I)alamin adenosyltransferase